MSLVLTPNILKPSGLTAIPNRLTRPAFGTQYGFDVELGLAAPGLSLEETAEDTISYTITSVNLATNYRVEKSTDGVSYTFLADHSSAGTYTDTGLSEGQTYYYRVRAENASFESDWTSASILLKAEFTTSTLSESETIENLDSTYTLTIRPEIAITSGTVTLTGLDVSQTVDNASLSITSTSNIFGTTADWTQSTGTLVLTVSTTVPNNADTVVTFTLQNPAYPNSGSTGITLDATGFTQASISGTFMSVSQDPLLNLPTFPTIALVSNETDVITRTDLTNPANKVTIVKALDTDDLYVWTGSYWVIFNDDGISP